MTNEEVDDSTKAEKHAQLKEKLGDKIPAGLIINDDLDATITRFLVARAYDLEKSTVMLSDAIEWRKEHNVDEWLSTPLDPLEVDELRSMIPMNPFYAYSKQGLPIMIQRIGQGKPAIANKYPPEKHVYMQILRMEFATDVVFREASARAGCLVDKEVSFLDLSGISLAALGCLSVFKAINAACSHNYPERSKSIYILNAPMIFSTLWSTISVLIDPRTVKKIKILSAGKKQLELLKEELDEEDIPTFLGGKYQGGWGGDDITPSSRDASDIADRNLSIYARMEKWIEGNCARREKDRPKPKPVISTSMSSLVSHGAPKYVGEGFFRGEGGSIEAGGGGTLRTVRFLEEADGPQGRVPEMYQGPEATLGLEQTLGKELQELNALLFEPNNPVDRAMLRNLKASDVDFGPWCYNDATGFPERIVEMKTPSEGVDDNSNKVSRVVETQRYTVVSPGQMYVVEACTSMPDSPYGSLYEVDTQYVLMALPRDSLANLPMSYLRVCYRVRCTPPTTVLRGMLTRTALADIRRHTILLHSLLARHASPVITDHLPPETLELGGFRPHPYLESLGLGEKAQLLFVPVTVASAAALILFPDVYELFFSVFEFIFRTLYYLLF